MLEMHSLMIKEMANSTTLVIYSSFNNTNKIVPKFMFAMWCEVQNNHWSYFKHINSLLFLHTRELQVWRLHNTSLTQLVQKFWGFTQAHIIITADENKIGKLDEKYKFSIYNKHDIFGNIT